MIDLDQLMADHFMGLAALEKMKRKFWVRGIRKTIEDMSVMAAVNDPFACGRDSQVRDGEWFANLWETLAIPRGAHVRRCHYRIVSQTTPPLLPDGKPYENTYKCWLYLQMASKYARHLDLVDPEAFDDRRNPDPLLFARYGSGLFEPEIVLPTLLEWIFPEIQTDLGSDFRLEIPHPEIEGYEYDQLDQPYHLELWIEKSTMNDVLEPVCAELGVNLVPSIGFQSITNTIRLLQRLQALNNLTERGHKVRIWYGSDFDPAGEHMPVAVARQLEFYRLKYAPDVEIKLQPLFLTKAQVQHYKLPRIPIKESDLRKKGFEDRHGEGAVELDALEALYPGELAQIVRAAVKPYRDSKLKTTMAKVRADAEKQVQEAWEAMLEPLREETEAIETAVQDITARYQERLEAMNEELQAELAPIRESATSVWQAIANAAQEFTCELPPRPEANIKSPNEKHWLFDSNRPYLHQIEVYKLRKDGP